MNGRGAVAFFGYALVLNAVLQIHYNRRLSLWVIVKVIAGIFLCSVSSGTFMSGILALAVAFWFELARLAKLSMSLRASRLGLILTFMALALLYFVWDFLAAGVLKNIDYYGGGAEGIVEMLNHGAGSVIYPFVRDLELWMITAILLVVAVLVSQALMTLPLGFMLHLILSAIAIGVFGYTTLALAFIPMMILGASIAKRIRIA